MSRYDNLMDRLRSGKRILKNWDGLVGVYAHTGAIVGGNWVFVILSSPEDYATHAG